MSNQVTNELTTSMTKYTEKNVCNTHIGRHKLGRDLASSKSLQERRILLISEGAELAVVDLEASLPHGDLVLAGRVGWHFGGIRLGIGAGA